MTALGECGRARAQIAARAAGLSASERIELEEHVERCATCARLARELDAVRTVLDEERPSLSKAAAERALARALERPSESSAPAERHRRPVRWALVGLAAAAIAITAYLTTRPADPATLVTHERMPAPARQEVRPPVPDEVVEPEAPPGADERLHPAGTRLRFAHADVEILEPARLSWSEPDATLSLQAGAASFEVDATLRAPFAVLHAGHRVEVLGTKFIVGEGRVRVIEGRVLVRAPSGRVRATLRAGETLDLTSVDVAPPVAAELARARRLIAAGELGDAHEVLVALEQRPLERRQRAEAETLDAEIAQVGGDARGAVARYLAIADEHPDLPAGENALFAAARLAARMGDEGRARTLLRRYVDTYADGRYRAEAMRRLGEGESP